MIGHVQHTDTKYIAMKSNPYPRYPRKNLNCANACLLL